MKLKRFLRANFKGFESFAIMVANVWFSKRLKGKFDLINFGLFDKNDSHDTKWIWWSRIYEYPWVIETIKETGLHDSTEIHNTSWGYSELHLDFKQELEGLARTVINSDINVSRCPNTFVYDITRKPPQLWKHRFNYVVNISTVEEIVGSHLKVIHNLLLMVKPGGHLLLTFDLPGLQLKSFQKLFGPLNVPKDPVNGCNSKVPIREFSYLNCGYLAIRRS